MRLVVTWTSRDLRSVGVVAHVIRVRPDAAQRTSRRGEHRLARHVPDLYCRKPGGPIIAVVTRCPEVVPAPHVVHFSHGIVWMMVMRCGWGGVVWRYRG